LTLRDAVVPELMVCVTLSDQVTLHGAVPVSVAVIVVEPPAQIAPPPLTVAVGRGLTVTVAEPLDVPLQVASVNDVTVYVVVADGLTLRDAVVPVLMVCVTLSDHVTVHGAVPVRMAVIVAEPPGHIAPPPPTVAVCSGRMVTVAEPLEVPLQFASASDVIVYVVVVAGVTLREAVVPLLIVCVTLSDQVTENGAVPVSAAVIVVEAPAQIVALPLTTAVGRGLTVTIAEPLDVPVQFASVSDVMV